MKVKNEYKSKLELGSWEVDMLADDIDVLLISYRDKINPETAHILCWLHSVLGNLCNENAEDITLIVKGEKKGEKPGDGD
jgi:hypothetical protein